MSKNIRKILFSASRKVCAIVLVTGMIGAKAYMIETENTHTGVSADAQTTTGQPIRLSAANADKN